MGKTADNMKHHVTISLEYSDESEVNFEVTMDGSECDAVATFIMVTRGTLQVSMARKATCYKDDGFELCSYVK